ncbi:putative inner membrane protein [Enterobacter hormaechei]|nr:putative inner membrane protein [Enterobacter hormaechei]
MAEVKRPPQQQTLPERKHGILYNLLWGWPWALVGVVLSSLLLSLLIEYIGIAFFWPEAGAAHSEAVMNTELGWLSTEFTRSLLLSEPSVTVVRWVTTAYQWAFVDSGFLDWVRRQYAHQMHSDNAVTREINSWSGWLAGYLREYLLATVWISIITLVRVTILVLSVPLFVLVVVVALVEGWGGVICGGTARGMKVRLSIIMPRSWSNRPLWCPPCCTFPGPRQSTPICCCCRRLFCWGSP